MEPEVCANGHGNPQGGRFCGVCGVPLAAVSPGPGSGPEAEMMLGPKSAPAPTFPEPEVRQPAARATSVWSRRRILVLASVAAGVLLIGAGIVFLVTTPAPDVTGMAKEQALTALEERGLAVQVAEAVFSDTVPQGSVASQEPSAGFPVLPGGSVSLVVSRGPARVVPDVEGSPRGTAMAEVRAVSLQPRVNEVVSEVVPKGEVIRQEPAPGTELEGGDSVTLTVSSGPPSTDVSVTFLYTDFDEGFDFVLNVGCSLAVRLLGGTYPDAVIENQDGEVVSSLRGGWPASPDNGAYLPCSAVGIFPNTPTTEEKYRIVFEPDDPVGNSSGWYSRQEMEAQEWEIVY